jgi:hypothetical protein
LNQGALGAGRLYRSPRSGKQGWNRPSGKVRQERHGYSRRAPEHDSSSVRSGMFRAECAVTTGLVALVSMALLTELVSTENGVCYRHGAANGAVRTSQRHIELKAAEN